ncbi:hypothetical protein L228DRAFT_283261 [Xylona heveae TC161]|uniref:Uncharacterized protein n=1 Tax=Xylona heveae (strain CBS 132557 / TC161) TaxID=1328760 RepID=A0A165GDW5_XYLHT|nr:hypothetical protein L228DRAFT_283261 [Xylona heveae TC161]KZF22074.1 hypothetical protein L228DRAFT_283261 [Xylona heveae TC161]
MEQSISLKKLAEPLFTAFRDRSQNYDSLEEEEESIASQDDTSLDDSISVNDDETPQEKLRASNTPASEEKTSSFKDYFVRLSRGNTEPLPPAEVLTNAQQGNSSGELAPPPSSLLRQSEAISFDSIFKAAAAQLIRNDPNRRKASSVPRISRPLVQETQAQRPKTLPQKKDAVQKKRVEFRKTPSVRIIRNNTTTTATNASRASVAARAPSTSRPSIVLQETQTPPKKIFRPTPGQAAFMATGMGLFAPHPLLPRSDSEFENGLHMLKEAAHDWARKWFGYKLFDSSDANSDEDSENEADPGLSRKEQRQKQRQAILFELYDLCETHPELVKYAGWIADGHYGWEEIFLDPDQRAVLVYGILGKVFEVHVFGRLLFGGTQSQVTALLSLEKESAHREGFKRTALRAAAVKTFLGDDIVPPAFESDVEQLTLRIYTLLSSLLPRSSFTSTTTTTTITTNAESNPDPAAAATAATATAATISPVINQFVSSLHALVRQAGKIAVDMRREDTIYYISPTYKDEMYDGKEMRGINFTPHKWGPRSDEERHRRRYEREAESKMERLQADTKTERQQDKSKTKRQQQKSAKDIEPKPKPWDEVNEGIPRSSRLPLVKVVCFPCITAYRPGSGREGGEDDGYRMRIISRADVFLHWGSQRSTKVRVTTEGKEKATNRPPLLKDPNDLTLVEWLEKIGEEKKKAGGKSAGCVVM